MSHLAEWIEALEQRVLFGAHRLGGLMMSPADDFASDSAQASPLNLGLTPSQIRNAYGIDQLGSLTGQGRTIAIVDAFNNPTIAQDLEVFDAQFGLAAPPGFRVIGQRGQRALPPANPKWAREICLDVEWAHAIAPGAKLMLVEAKNDQLKNLVQATDFARHIASASVVSISWTGAEFKGESRYNGIFRTPPDHKGVTFVAATGDLHGAAEWPSAVPGVLAVGGTHLQLSATGSYEQETSWQSGAGGDSTYEREPRYQQIVQDSGKRSVPDVAFQADPSEGYTVYDTYGIQSGSGWVVIGGTSAASAQWAGLIAVADQARKSSGLGSLGGASQTSPLIYRYYSPPSKSQEAIFQGAFNPHVASVLMFRLLGHLVTV